MTMLKEFRLEGGTRRKLIHFVRHAVAEHNVAAAKHNRSAYLREDLFDAVITKEGADQCAALRDKMVESGCTSQLLLVSPLRRTLETATLCFPSLVNSIPWIALECIREVTGQHPCDRRCAVSETSCKYPHVDFGLIESDTDELYASYTHREPNEHAEARAREFLNYVSSCQEEEILVVTHSAFLRILYTRVFGVDLQNFNGFKNCEVRSVEIYFP